MISWLWEKKCIGESSEKITITVICLTHFKAHFWCHLQMHFFFFQMLLKHCTFFFSTGCSIISFIFQFRFVFKIRSKRLLGFGLLDTYFKYVIFDIHILGQAYFLKLVAYGAYTTVFWRFVRIMNLMIYSLSNQQLKLEVRFSLLSTNKCRVSKQVWNKVLSTIPKLSKVRCISSSSLKSPG